MTEHMPHQPIQRTPQDPLQTADAGLPQLLERFFRQEMSTAFRADRLTGLDPLKDSAIHPVPMAGTRLTTLPQQPMLIKNRALTVRMSVATTLAATAMLAVVLMSVDTGTLSAIGKPRNTDSLSSAQPGDLQEQATEEQLMLVSPGAGQNGHGQSVLGNDGVTVEEADSVDLNPGLAPGNPQHQ